ncbi:MAG TPA: cation:proton antiporter [Gemmatimonadaceae bacterium]|nr:cation:proton antiporter [Gemmatimonadaceae bacterium]
MHETHQFLANLALVMCVAAATTVLFQRLRQPVVFGYLLAGMIIGPHTPIPLTADETAARTLSGLGVILLMYALGLEFSLRKLIQVAPTAGIIAVIECSMMMWLGYTMGRMFGWTTLESVYAGAMIAIASTTIVVKAFSAQNITGQGTDLVFGILIIEDLIGIFLLAVLTAISTGSGVSARSLGLTAARLVMFLVSLVGLGLLIIPRLVRSVVRLNRPETTLVTTVGICFAAALLALSFGYSVALGAFIAGSLVGESGEAKIVEQLITPVRDMFVAIFFVAVGMMIDPGVLAQHWFVVVVLTVAVIVGKTIAVSMGGVLAGYTIQTSAQAGMSLTQIGEFSFIIAGVGLARGATHGFLYPVVIAVSAITTLTTPWLIRASGPASAVIDRAIPDALQTFLGLYGSWLERLRSAPAEVETRPRLRRMIRLLLLDAALLVALVIGVSLDIDRVTALLSAATTLSPSLVRLALITGAVVIAIPLILGFIRSAGVIGQMLALRVMPAAGDGAMDQAAAPRRVVVITLQLGIVCLAGAPVIAITQPFLPPIRGTVMLVVVLGILGVLLWRGATTLHGQARAGAEVIVAALAQQMADAPEPRAGDVRDLASMNLALHGFGEPVLVRLDAESRAINRTLAQCNLRGLTGATVLAILRDGQRIVLPMGREVLRVGDVLALSGTRDAVDRATVLLGAEEREDAAQPS